MKTNMQMLRNLIREEEENLDLVRFSSQEYLFNKVNEELSGKITILVDNTEKMLEKLKETEDLTNRINYLKRTLFKKENELRLEDGRTVKQASVENKYNLKLKYYYEALLRKENKKIRMTDSKSAYFLEYKLNIDRNEIKEKLKNISEEIKNTTNEIIRLNGKIFEIDLPWWYHKAIEWFKLSKNLSQCFIKQMITYFKIRSLTTSLPKVL